MKNFLLSISLNDYIHEGAQRFPQKLAVVTPDEQATYAQLSSRIRERATKLKADGLTPCHGYVFRASQTIDFLVTYFAIHECHAVAVPLEQSVPADTFRNITEQVATYDFPAGSSDLLYTSGSTGKSKGVILSEVALTTCAENFINSHPYSSATVFIISGPLNHIASLFKIHPTIMAGGTVCVINGIKDLDAFYDVFRQYPDRRFASFLVPASIRMLLQFSREELASVADKIDFIETGAAPITESDMQQLSAVLPNAKLFNSLGGTEIGAVCTYNFNDGKHMAGCVGKPMLHSQLSLSPDGTIIVSGPTLMTGYINDPERTQSVLRDGCFYTSDRGYFDAEGNLHILGRNDDVINVGGFKADPIEIENMALTFEAISDCICIPAPHPIAGTCVKLLYVVKEGSTCRPRDIAQYLTGKLEAYKVPSLYEPVETIELQSNGKKNRQFYQK